MKQALRPLAQAASAGHASGRQLAAQGLGHCRRIREGRAKEGHGPVAELFAQPLDCERVRQITQTLVERYPLPVTY